MNGNNLATYFDFRTSAIAAIATASMTALARGDTTPQTLPFSQDWTNTELITTGGDWSGVPGVIGYRGDGLVASMGVNPQTVLADGSSTPVSILANQPNPSIITTGGVGEFQTIADPVVGVQGTGVASAPHIVLSLNTTGLQTITLSFNARDIDSFDNAVQQIAVHYRVGNSGSYTDLPAGFIPDATTTQATLVTARTVVLPANADNQPLVNIRIMTTDAVGTDEWVGLDDITVSGTPCEACSDAIVDCITYETLAANPRTLRVSIRIVDGSGNAVVGAVVSALIIGQATSFNVSGITGANGTVVFANRPAGNSCFTTDVTNVVKPGFAFDGAEPTNGFQKGVDTSPDTDCRSASDVCGSG